ncbi:NAD(P)-binding domain-containing protein [Arthrobacter sp. SA17]
MKVSVIGAGAIGGNIARRLSEAGHEVLIANSRGPESVSTEVSDAGAQPAELEAVTQDRDVIILAVPFGVQPKLKALGRDRTGEHGGRGHVKLLPRNERAHRGRH